MTSDDEFPSEAARTLSQTEIEEDQRQLQDISSLPTEEVALPPRLVHTVIFFVMAIALLLIGELVTVGVARRLPVFRHESFLSLASDARLMIPAQAIQYGALVWITVLLFRAIWQQPFWKAIHWNVAAVAKWWLFLVSLGLILGLSTSLASNYLPMPKEAPILNDLMNSSVGAWLMFVFGTTGAPLVEELAFRGFLLPSLLNAFSTQRRGKATFLLGASASVLVTSFLFAILHSLQVSHAWAPVLLIGLVSVALCWVRMWTGSLAASTLVHASYNFSLFAGMLIASSGFRHLEKLNT